VSTDNIFGLNFVTNFSDSLIVSKFITVLIYAVNIEIKC